MPSQMTGVIGSQEFRHFDKIDSWPTYCMDYDPSECIVILLITSRLAVVSSGWDSHFPISRTIHDCVFPIFSFWNKERGMYENP